MCIRSLFVSTFGVLAGLIFTAVTAGAIPYTVTLNTSPLISGSTGPYYLEFQLVDGDGIANNSVTLSNFVFGGGNATGSTSYQGGASGDLSSSVTLFDSLFFNSFYEQFKPGNVLSFDVDMTANYTDPTPDRFTFAILNSSEFEIPTEGLGSELLGVDMKLPLVFETYKGTGGSDPALEAPSVSAVPEPSTFLLLTGGVAFGLFIRRRRQ